MLCSAILRFVACVLSRKSTIISLMLSVQVFQLPATRHVGLPRACPGADLPGDADHFGGEGAQLSTIAFTVDLRSRISPRAWTVILRKSSPLATACDQRDVAHLRGQVTARVFTLSVRSFQCRPRRHLRLAAQLSFVPTSPRHRVTSPRRREADPSSLDGFLQLQDLALGGNGDLPRRVRELPRVTSAMLRT